MGKQTKEGMKKEYRKVLDAIFSPMCFITEEGLVKYANKACRELLGKEIIGLDAGTLVAEGQEEACLAFKRMAKEDLEEGIEFRMANEPRTWVQVKAVLTNHPLMGRVFVANIFDISPWKSSQSALRQEHDRVRHIFNIAGTILIQLDQQGKVMDINDKGCEILGYQREAIVGKTWFDAFLPEDERKDVTRMFSLLMKGEFPPGRFENLIKTKKGERLVSWYNSLIKDEKGNIIGVLSSGEDITSRKASEEALRRSEEKYRAVFENTKSATVIIGEDTIIRLANEQFCFLSGFAKEEIEGKLSWTSFVSEKDLGTMRSYHDQRRSDPEHTPRTYEFSFVTRSGEKRDILLTVGIIPGSSDSVASLIDITQHKLDKERLDQTERNYRTIFNVSKDGIVVQDAKTGGFVDSNKAFSLMFGYSKEEQRSLRQDMLLAKDPRVTLEEIKGFFSSARKGRPQRFEWKAKSKSGKEFWVETNLFSASLSGERCVIAVLRDVSDRKAAELQAIASRDELKDIINSASDLIMSVNAKGRVTAWNHAFETLSGLRSQQMLKSSVLGDGFPNCMQSIGALLRSMLRSRRSEMSEIEIHDVNGNPYIILASANIVYNHEHELVGLVLTARDISDERNMFREVRPGYSYIAENVGLNEIISRVCMVFSTKGYSCVTVTRDDVSVIAPKLPVHALLIMLSEVGSEEFLALTDPDTIFPRIKDHFEKHGRVIILLHRMDYIASRFGFDALLKFVYRINDLVRYSESIFTLQVEKGCFSEQELVLLRQEFVPFPKENRQEEHLEEEKVAMLRFVANKNSLHFKVPFNMLSSEFKLARMTTKKYVDDLVSKGLIRVEKDGRSKFIYITEKGRRLLASL